jgi:hypothetical protein
MHSTERVHRQPQFAGERGDVDHPTAGGGERRQQLLREQRRAEHIDLQLMLHLRRAVAGKGAVQGVASVVDQTIQALDACRDRGDLRCIAQIEWQQACAGE